MIEIGTVTAQNAKQSTVTVSFEQLGTQAECCVLQQSTGTNSVFILPSIDTQVVCWLEGGKNIALGALFSDSDSTPSGAKADGYYQQIGDVSFQITEDRASLKNSSSDLKTLLDDILKAIQNLTVSTPMGPSGTPLPPTVQAVEKCVQDLNNLLK